MTYAGALYNLQLKGFARYPLLDCLVFRQMQFEIVTAASILVVAHTARGVDRAAPHCVGDRWSARA